MKRTNSAVWMEKYKRWQIKVQKDGERRTFYSSTPGRNGQREANAKADAWLDDGVANDQKRMEELWAEFIAVKKSTTGSANVRKLTESWNNDISPAIGKKRIRSVTENDLQKIIDQAYAQRKLSRKSLSNIRSCIQQLFKFCRKRLKVTSLDPELEIPAAATSQQRQILQPQDLRTLFTVDTMLHYGKRLPDPSIHAYRFQVLTGLRPGELLGLQYGDIQGNHVQISRSVNYSREVTRGKNANAVRRFALSPRAKAELDAQIKALPGPVTATTRIFPFESEAQYRKRWVKYSVSNGLTPTSPYELRHTFVSVAKYLPAGEVKSLVGHSAAMDTFGVYGHELDGDAEALAADVERLFDRLLPEAK